MRPVLKKQFPFGVSRCKLVYIEWINNKILLYSTENYTQYPVIDQNGKEFEKECVCIYRYIYIYKVNIYVIYIYKVESLSVQQKLTQHCKSTIL